MTEPDVAARQRAFRLRKRMKRRKPNFVRPESWRYVRLKKNWRKPRGLDHKVRLQYDGWPPGAAAGYRSPKIARGLHPSGYAEAIVHNVEELSQVDPNVQVARIAHTVGKRKRTRILAEARRKRITILNIKQTKEPIVKEEEQEKPEEKKAETEEKQQKKLPEKQQRRTRKRKEGDNKE
jgi:large subunit ribosomal protein L32e